MMKAHRIVGGSHRPPPDQGHRPGSNSAVPPDRAEPPNPLRRELRLRPRFRAREPPGPATARAASTAIGRASCSARVCQYVEISVVAVLLKTKHSNTEQII